MKLQKLAAQIDAEILTQGDKADHIEINHIYAGDNISDILNHASDTTLLVTNLSSCMLPRIAELMDVPGICLLNGIVPDPGLMEAANEHGIVLLVAPHDMFETCGRLYKFVSKLMTATT